ncbi:MAG: phosphatase PAP2 family protein [Microbacterium sp.]
MSTARPVDDEVITTALRQLVVGAALVAIAALVGILVTTFEGPHLDQWWNDAAARLSSLQSFALGMDFVGGGWFASFVVPLGALAVLVLLRRPWAGAFVVAASAGSALVVQALKGLFGRARPEEMIVLSDYGSFPSGHTANAATLAVIAVVLCARIWVAVVGLAWVMAMALSRTLVHAHWLTDTIGGALAGCGAALVLAAAFAVVLSRERERMPHPA